MAKQLKEGTFNEAEFWAKVTRYARRMGRTVLRPAFILYYLWLKPTTPVWAKTIIAAALIYLVCPVDAIPDIIPGGFVDDAGVLAGAVATLAAHVDETVTSQADRKLRKYLPE